MTLEESVGSDTRPRVFLQPIAAPSILGLYGLAGATFMVGAQMYNKPIAVNDEKLSPAETSEEERKLRREVEKRRHETPGQRDRRIRKYQRERRQDHELMSEMVNASNFQPAREETVNGRHCFVLTATPRNNYQPRSRETKVLTGMRGKIWIDADRFQWVKVHAEVFRPVAFGLFIAHVYPGNGIHAGRGAGKRKSMAAESFFHACESHDSVFFPQFIR